MIRYTTGNLLEAKAEALVNTVNTVGVMGKGIALMFKEAFPENYRLYRGACEKNEVRIGEMFVTKQNELIGSVKWIVNFPTKKHWKNKADLEWITDGLVALRSFIQGNNIHSIAIPPLGCGNGGLDWAIVRPEIVKALGDLTRVDIFVYKPTSRYQNVSKTHGVGKLTPARAMIAEMVRQYWVMGIECSLLEIQKLAWFLELGIQSQSHENPLDLRFTADRYGPYAYRLDYLLNSLDGSFLHCAKRLADAGPMDTVWFDDSRREQLQMYLTEEEFRPYVKALDYTREVVDGFESPLGLELLATVNWLIVKENCHPTICEIRKGLSCWPGEPSVAARKLRIFDDRLIGIALNRLTSTSL